MIPHHLKYPVPFPLQCYYPSLYSHLSLAQRQIQGHHLGVHGANKAGSEARGSRVRGIWYILLDSGQGQ